jgi:hypothetical protein
MKKKSKLTLILEEYPTKIMISKARRPTYKKSSDGSFELDKDKNRIITNKRTVGTPRYLAINTQKFYSGFGSEHQRIMIVEGLKNYYKEPLSKLKDLPPFPLYIEFKFHTTITREYDLDNMSWIYIKTFHDALKKAGKIPDDSVRYILKYSAELVEIDDFDKRRIEITFKTHD